MVWDLGFFFSQKPIFGYVSWNDVSFVKTGERRTLTVVRYDTLEIRAGNGQE